MENSELTSAEPFPNLPKKKREKRKKREREREKD